MLKIKVQWYLQYQIQSNKQLGTENFNKLKSSGKEKGLQIFFSQKSFYFAWMWLLHYFWYIIYKFLHTKTKQTKVE